MTGRSSPDPAHDVRHLARPDGTRLAYRIAGNGPPLLLLHATLSSGSQLVPLARLLADHARVIVPDRRGSGASRLDRPRPVAIDEQVEDLLAVLDAEAVGRIFLVGHSFGGVVGLALAALAPDRVTGAVLYEPPFLLALSPAELGEMASLGARIAAAHERAGGPAAAETFLRAIVGDDGFEAYAPRQRAALLGLGDGVLADATFQGLDRVDLGAIQSPVTLVSGSASSGFYARIADALGDLIPQARRVTLEGLAHAAPITDPGPVAREVVGALGNLRP